MDLFGGIGGSRAALDLLGVYVAGHVVSEIDPVPRKVVSTRWPEAVDWGAVETIGEEQINRIPLDFPNALVVIVAGGSPCQDVSSANVGGPGHTGDRSRLFVWVRIIADMIQRKFPYLVVKAFLENVASMDKVDRDAYTRQFGCQPLWACPRQFAWARRPRYYWMDWKVRNGPDAKIHDSDDVPWLETSAARIPLETWADEGVSPKRVTVPACLCSCRQNLAKSRRSPR